MPVSNADVIDAIGIDPAAGCVFMAMYEDRAWQTPLLEFENKVNGYLQFIISRQINQFSEYSGKPIVIEIFCQHAPPRDVLHVFRQARLHLRAHGISFRAFHGPDRSCPIDLEDGWR